MRRMIRVNFLNKKGTLVPFLFCAISIFKAQNSLYIPDTLSGTSITLTVKSSTKQFFGTNTTPTYGYNGSFLGPTIFLNKDDSVTLNVTNSLSLATTVHWHGLHVSPQNDGGPQQVIQPNTTWSPSFKVRNEASTFWYHPHGDGKTEIQISKGLAGMIIVRDNIEKTYVLPRSYKVDDFPLIVQSKNFDVFYQFATATHEDSILMVNGTLKPYLQVPKQVVRLRLLNGSADRTYNFGLSNNSNFYLIGSDGGLLSQPYLTNRVRLSTGERAEILLDLSTYPVGSQLYLKSYASELPRGIIGADSVGTAAILIGEGYYSNPLNGADFNILRLDIIPATANAITSIPTSFAPKVPISTASVNVIRRVLFSPDTVLSGQEGKVDGPFFMNDKAFHMDSINIITYLNTVEIWKLVNKTLVAHPFHIHDIEFFVLDINGIPPPPQYQGLKDVILVQPNDTVRFITKFTTFADPYVPYMYHCHLLHHEDDGMMGTFLVIDPATVSIKKQTEENSKFQLFPNPSNGILTIRTGKVGQSIYARIWDSSGQMIYEASLRGTLKIDVSAWAKGLYLAEIIDGNSPETRKFVVE